MASDTNAGSGLLGQYYDNADLTGLALTRIDPNIQFNWGSGSPSGNIGTDTFSVRWSGQVEAVFTESYSFIVNADDGVRLWVDGQLLVNQWTASSVINATGAVNLIAGRHYDLQLEYVENTNNASVSLEWSSPSQTRSIVPTNRLFPSERGTITQERWTGIAGSTISSLTSNSSYPNSPSSISSLSKFEISANAADSYGDRILGLLNPQTTGEYTFYVSGDEASELWLSNSSDPANKQRIAWNDSATNAREWNRFSSQRSSVINLVAGQSYYIEGLHKESTGNDHFAVAWTRSGQSSIDIIDGEFLSPSLPTVSLYSDVPSANEGVGGAGRVSVVRTGMPTTNALTVSYSVRGTATNGVDYTTLPGTITIPAGQSSAFIDITALNDALVEGTESIVVELSEGNGYDVGLLSQRTATVSIQDNANAPAGGSSIIAGSGLSSFSYFGGTFSTVVDATYGNVIQAVITGTPANPWNAQLRQSINKAVKKGDILYFEFYVRSATATGIATSIFELNGSPYTKSLDQGLTATSTWSRIQLPFVSAEDYSVGQAAIGFHLGAQAQTLQFFGFQLLNYGPSSKLEPSSGMSLQNIGGNFGTMQAVAVSGQSFTSANQIDTVTTPPNNETWRLQTVIQNASPVKNGDVLQYEFWARGVAGATPRVAIAVQESYGSYTTLTYNQINLGSAWQKYTTNVTVAKDYAANTLQITFNVGFAPQSIQIGALTWRNTSRGVLMESLPFRTATATYSGRSGTDAWRSDADARIAQNRMGDLTVHVVDANGNPIDGAVVQLKQKRQAFRFGTAINGYSNLLATNGTAEALKYQSEIKRLFNAVVIENNLKWPDFLNNRQLGIDAANWAVNNGLYLRGHNIVWPSRTFMPASVWSQYDSLVSSQGATAAANYLRTTIRSRVADDATTFQGKAGEWDVVNEPYANHDAMDILGNDELLEWFRLFRTNAPTAKRVLNDYDIFSRNGANSDHRTNFDYWLGRLTSQGLLETIGEQSHYGESNLTDIAKLGQLIQLYGSTFNLPIAITEFDINTKSEQLQADYLRDYMTMVFSQPAASEFIQWGFWSKSHWLPDAALFRDDFSIKPNGQAYEDLVFGDWWTSTRGTTRLGQLQSRVFTGDFDVVVLWNGQTISSTTTVSTIGNNLNIVIPGVHVPTDVSISSAIIDENSAANSTIGTMATTDADSGDTFTYALVAGTGSSDNNSFSIVGGSLKANASFDFETKSVYTIRVRTTDSTGLAFEKPLTVFVKNTLETNGAALDLLVPLYSYPTFTDGTQSQLSQWWGDVRNSASIAQPITVIINPLSGPIDPLSTTYAGQYHDYTAALRLLRANAFVRILGYLPTTYGAKPLSQVSQYLDWYSSGYKDINGSSLLDGIFLDEFSNDIATLAYYRAVRADIRSRASLASNWIVGNTGVAVANSVFYTEPLADVFLSYENIESPSSGTVFSQSTVPSNAATGVSFAAVVYSVATNADMRRVMKLAKFKGYAYAYVTDDILQDPYDDEAGYWSSLLLETHRPVIVDQQKSIAENATIGTVLGNVNAFDPDPAQSLSYSIIQGNVANAFSISSSGVISLASNLDYETTPTYYLTVQVTDSSASALTDSATVTIQIGDINEPPLVNATLTSLSGVVQTIFANNGTWLDPESASVTLIASLGVVVKNANGTWNWSYSPPSVVSNQNVTITANDGVNLSSISFTLTATPANPTLSITSGNRTYDRTAYTATASLSGAATPTPSISFVYYSDAAGSIVIPAPTIAGTYYVRAIAAGNSNNNAAQSLLSSFTIGKASLIGSVTVANKSFDNTTTATIATRSLSGVIGTDVVLLLGGTATFGDAGVGKNKTVSITGLALSGADAANYTVNASTTALADITGTVFNRQVYYKGSSFSAGGTNIAAALDTAKVIAKSGSTAQTLSYANLINTTRGINGVVLDIAGLDATTLAASDFTFRMSPTGAFNEAANPPDSWTTNIPAPTGIFVTQGSATVPSRVRLEWADNAIANRWLQIRVLANSHTGLQSAETFYIGHLQGKVLSTTVAGIFFVTTQDQTAVLPFGTATVTSNRDLDKNGFITTQDVTAVRLSIVASRSLRVITIPAAGSGAEGAGGFSGSSSFSAPVLPPRKNGSDLADPFELFRSGNAGNRTDPGTDTKASLTGTVSSQESSQASMLSTSHLPLVPATKTQSELETRNRLATPLESRLVDELFQAGLTSDRDLGY